MDPVKLEKLQAMKSYRKNCLLTNLIQYSLCVVFFGLFLSSPLWLPKLCSSLRHFFLVSLPGLGNFLFCPKCLFVVGNAIVIFLVGESKLSSGTAGTTAPPDDIYEEYVERSRRLRGCICTTFVVEGKETKPEGSVVEGSILERKNEVSEEREEEEEEEEEERGEDEGGDYREEEFDGEEEDDALPADEINKRADNFIARSNEQWRLEAMMLVCHG